MNYILFSIILSLISIKQIICAEVNITTDGPGVLDIPMTFCAKLSGETPIDVEKFWYVFEDLRIFPRHREEVLSGKEANFTLTYNSSQMSVGEYHMRVQVYVDIWGWKGWMITENRLTFSLQNSIKIEVSLHQSGVLEEALLKSKVAANRTVEIMAQIEASEYVKNGTNSYTWKLDGRTLGPFSSPDLNYTFVSNGSYPLRLLFTSNISLPNSNITKFGHIDQKIIVKNEIKDMNISGNTWLLDGALLQLQVNCTGGDPPFRYCYDFFHTKQTNYTCVPQMIYRNECYFPITHYFPKNGTYFIEIMTFNEINFKHKSISVKVYDIVRKTQLIFVILPIMSSILAIIIIVVGIAYHLQQRQRMNETLEVADFDFQNNDNLMVKTFFERLRESLGTALRDTFTYPCNPCTRPNNCDDLMDDTLPEETISVRNNNRSPINTSAVIK